MRTLWSLWLTVWVVAIVSVPAFGQSVENEQMRDDVSLEHRVARAQGIAVVSVPKAPAYALQRYEVVVEEVVKGDWEVGDRVELRAWDGVYGHMRLGRIPGLGRDEPRDRAYEAGATRLLVLARRESGGSWRMAETVRLAPMGTIRIVTGHVIPADDVVEGVRALCELQQVEGDAEAAKGWAAGLRSDNEVLRATLLHRDMEPPRSPKQLELSNESRWRDLQRTSLAMKGLHPDVALGIVRQFELLRSEIVAGVGHAAGAPGGARSRLTAYERLLALMEQKIESDTEAFERALESARASALSFPPAGAEPQSIKDHRAERQTAIRYLLLRLDVKGAEAIHAGMHETSRSRDPFERADAKKFPKWLAEAGRLDSEPRIRFLELLIADLASDDDKTRRTALAALPLCAGTTRPKTEEEWRAWWASRRDR